MERKTKTIKLAAVLLAAALTAGIPASAKAGSGILSPGLAVVAEKYGMVKSGLASEDIFFTGEDFADALGVGKVSSVRIRSLPPESAGILKVGSERVEAGDKISRGKLSKLRFVPGGAGECGFTFSVGSDGVVYECTVYALSEPNESPVITQPEAVATGVFSGVTYSGTLRADDPENDPVTFEIISAPKHGSVSLTDASRGYYVYTAEEGYTGADSFVAQAADKYGNKSNAVKQTLHVASFDSAYSFTDMKGHWAESAVMVCAEAGAVSAGEAFNPSEPVSRVEFLSMIMTAAGYDGFSAAATGFADDAEIPAALRGTVAAAETIGIVSGIPMDGGVYFCPNNQITRAEASVMLARLTGLTTQNGALEVFAERAVEDESVPAWASSSMASLLSEGILRGDGSSLAPYRAMTRAEAAQLAASVIARRNG